MRLLGPELGGGFPKPPADTERVFVVSPFLDTKTVRSVAAWGNAMRAVHGPDVLCCYLRHDRRRSDDQRLRTLAPLALACLSTTEFRLGHMPLTPP